MTLSLLLAPLTCLLADEPQIFSPDAFAQPITTAADEASAPAAANAPLRWKSKPVGATRQIGDGDQPLAQPAGARGWNKTRMDHQVRQAQAISSDPFSDPFGDRGAVRQAADIELEPTEAESGRPGAAAANGVEELPAPAPRPLRTLQGPTMSSPGPTFVQQPSAPDLSPMGPAIPAEPAAPGSPRSLSDRSGVPCERIYNDRDCCALEANCKAFREQLITDSIRNISLDITPRFEPNLTADEDAEARQNRLSAQEMFRPWKNKQGEVIATGRMTDLANGRVIIADESGKEVARIHWNELGDDELCWINAYWRLPVECALGGRSLVARNWLPSTFHWHASALCHKPLYFEDVQLERYGHTAGPLRQPVLSGAHFFLNIAALPYNMAINPPHECQYALGYYRPGSCAPWMIQPVPLSLRGAIAEVGAVVGGVYLIP